MPFTIITKEQEVIRRLVLEGRKCNGRDDSADSCCMTAVMLVQNRWQRSHETRPQRFDRLWIAPFVYMDALTLQPVSVVS